MELAQPLIRPVLYLQRAFREKSTNWLKIQPKDEEGFRTFADCLHECQGAMLHVKGLDIRKDCEETLKVQKLPDWASCSRYRRKAGDNLLGSSESPTDKRYLQQKKTKSSVVHTDGCRD